MVRFLIALFLLSCSDKGTSTHGDTNTDGDLSCEPRKSKSCPITAEAIYPVTGQADVYHRYPIQVALSQPDSSAHITLCDADNQPVAGTFEGDEVVTFTPDAPLVPMSSYTVHLDWCANNNWPSGASYSFTTSDLGTPLTASLEGRTYTATLDEVTLTEPDGADNFFGLVPELDRLLLTVVSADADAMTGRMASADGSSQDACLPTVEFPTAALDGAFFATAPADVVITPADVQVPLYGAVFTGTFSSDASMVGGGTMTGQIDARDLGPVLKGQVDNTSPGYICNLLDGFGLPCESCDSDGEPYCIPLSIRSFTANEAAATAPTCIDQASCHPDCGVSTCADPDDGLCP